MSRPSPSVRLSVCDLVLAIKPYGGFSLEFLTDSCPVCASVVKMISVKEILL